MNQPTQQMSKSERLLVALMAGNAFFSILLFFIHARFDSPEWRSINLAAILFSFCFETYGVLRILKEQMRYVIILTVLFGFYGVHNFVNAAMAALIPSWIAVAFIAAAVFYSLAAVKLARLWASRGVLPPSQEEEPHEDR